MSDCKATLILSRDDGDNICTIRCQLKKGHLGRHVERFKLDVLVEVYFEREVEENR